MKNYGFIRAAAAVNINKVGDVGFNSLMVKTTVNDACKAGISLLVFPELYLTGYTCGDLFGQSLLIKEAEARIAEIADCSSGKDLTVVIGAPVAYCGRLYDCAVVVRDGNINGIVPKTFISPSESRWFASGTDFLCRCSDGSEGTMMYAGRQCRISPNILFGIGEATFAVEFESDLHAPVSPSSFHTVAGAQIIACLAAGNETLGSDRIRTGMLSQHSLKTLSAYVYASAKGESTQDTVYAGAGYIWETGEKLASCELFTDANDFVIADIDIEKIDSMRRRSGSFHAVSPDGTPSSAYRGMYSMIPTGPAADTDFGNTFHRYIEPHPFAPSSDLDEVCRKALAIQVEGLCGRLSKIGSKAIIGVSGGLDSTLALIVTALAFDRLGRTCKDGKWSRSNIIGITMPGFGTTSRTKNNAWKLMEALGATCREIPIGEAVAQHFKDISHDPSVHDATYENSQARERTQILMDVANQTGGIVIGTGDLSELALGWATYNGDHMSMYAVNAGIPKTLVRSLVKWAAENCFGTDSSSEVVHILLDIVDTPISPELLPANENDEIQQVTEDLVGPYELHDFFIWNFMKNGYGPEKILFLAKKAFCHYEEETIKKWLKTFIRRFFNQQFKRSCMPDGPQVSDVSLSPRGGWKMPSDAWSTLFCDNA